MSENPWQHIDELKAKFDVEMAETKNALEPLGAINGSVTLDALGRWTCRYIPKGMRAQERLTDRAGGGARRAAEGHPHAGEPAEARAVRRGGAES